VTTQHLRGSAGSIALANGATLAEVSEFLRHANVHVTAVSYVDVLEGDSGRAMQIAADAWGAPRVATPVATTERTARPVASRGPVPIPRSHAERDAA
jgi:hypothetical protein